MPRPRSDDRRAAILAAAARVVAVQGLGAATATIAKEAGVSNGSLFTYFDTKADLLNQLYLEVKADMGAAALAGLPVDDDLQAQLRHVWSRWLRWATAHPEKRRVLAQLDVSDEITAETHRAASESLGGLAGVLERGRAAGPMRDAAPAFALALASALAEATIDYIGRDPEHADAHDRAGFAALWRLIG